MSKQFINEYQFLCMQTENSLKVIFTQIANGVILQFKKVGRYKIAHYFCTNDERRYWLYDDLSIYDSGSSIKTHKPITCKLKNLET